MPHKKTPEQIRRLKELGAFDVGQYTLPIGFSRKRRYVRWDRDEDED